MQKAGADDGADDGRRRQTTAQGLVACSGRVDAVVRERFFRRAVAAVAGLMALASSGMARAEAAGATSTSVGPRAERVEWNEAWARFRWWEYAVTPIALLGGASLRLFVGPPKDRWRDVPRFDDIFYRTIAIHEDNAARSFWQTFSDVSFRAAMLHPAIDVGIAALVHREPGVAWQMLMIDLEGFAVTGLGVFGLQALVARERPYGRNCGGRDADGDCEEADRWRSFPSGHVAIGVAGAALTCMHHARIPLYGGGIADAAGCWASIALATGNLVGRVAANRHYVTDVLVGGAIGLLGGYVVPSALHYGFRDNPAPPSASPKAAPRKKAQGVRMTLTPLAGDSTYGAALAGIFY